MRAMMLQTQQLTRVSVPHIINPTTVFSPSIQKRLKRRPTTRDPVADDAPGATLEHTLLHHPDIRNHQQLATDLSHTRESINPDYASQLRRESPTLRSGSALLVRGQSRNRWLHHLTQRFNIVENEVYQDIVVLEAETCKLLHYRQFMRHPTHKVRKTQ